MSDEALVWKFAFGVLVLLSCGVWLVARHEPRPVAAHPAAVTPGPARPVVTAPAPLPAASAPPGVQAQPAPADLPDAQDAPVRIRIALREPALREPAAHAPAPQTTKKQKAKPHKRVRQAPLGQKIRFVHAAHRQSPYTIGRKHYPIDPREHWRRDLAQAY